MASRQMQIDSLSSAERAEQDIWVQVQLGLNPGKCVAGYGWYRISGGYRW
jgi:hypothetical protein